jgi:hypothetical protein
MLSQEDRYELNEGKEISLVPGLHRFRSEVMDAIRPDTVIVLDSLVHHRGILRQRAGAPHRPHLGRTAARDEPGAL